MSFGLCSYVLDIETGQSFFLTAVIYTNENGIVNDDVYEYEDVADKVMADLGEVVADALWTVPEKATNNSTPFDRTPSSLWSTLNQTISKSGQFALVGEKLEVEEKSDETLVSPGASESKIRSCYQYFIDE